MKPPGSGEKALLRVRHETRLEYDDRVVEAHSEVRKLPTDTGLQLVVTAHLDVDPAVTVRHHTDYFGNRVSHFNVLDAHDALVLRAESVVETTSAIACGPEAKPDPRPWPERWAEYLHWSPAVPGIDRYTEIQHGVRPDLEAEAFVDSLQSLVDGFYDRFRYDEQATDVDSGPEVFFEKGGGVCQDFAHAMIGVLRAAGVPARYASGYLYDPVCDPEWGGDEAMRGAAASHAWVQAWHPGLGWVGADPTNRKLVDWQYVRVAIGRDYRDVQPTRGVFQGRCAQRLSVAVDVERLA